MARGQLTLIIIIALLILIMVGIILYAARSASTKRGEERVETQERTAALMKPVQEFVTQCLDLAARDAIDLLGRQGGVIYQSQNGLTQGPFTPGVDHLPQTDAKIAYAIVPPEGSVGTVFYAATPEYPWGTFPAIYNTSGALLLAQYLQGYYGINRLPQLQRPDQDSVQEQIETMALERVKSCAKWDIFAQQGITVEPGTASLRVVFGEQGTSFLLSWPLDLTAVVSGTTANTDSFATEVPVRLRTILDVAHAVVDKDVTDITFDTSSATLNDVAISTARNVYQNDDIIKLVDPRSSLAGRQYIFQFARKNRAPALVWVPNATVASAKLCDGSTVSLDGAQLAGTLNCNDDGTFNGFGAALKAYDPDEDNLTFSANAGQQNQPVAPIYTVSSSDATVGLLYVTVSASDTQLTDYQTLSVPVDFNPPPP